MREWAVSCIICVVFSRGHIDDTEAHGIAARGVSAPRRMAFLAGYGKHVAGAAAPLRNAGAHRVLGRRRGGRIRPCVRSAVRLGTHRPRDKKKSNHPTI